MGKNKDVGLIQGYKESVVGSVSGTILGIFSGIFCKIFGIDWKLKIVIFLALGVLAQTLLYALFSKLFKMKDIEKFRNSFFALYLTTWYAAWVFFLNYPVF